MSEYEQGFNAAKEIALGIAERFAEQLPGAEAVLKKHLLDPLESMELKKKELAQ